MTGPRRDAGLEDPGELVREKVSDARAGVEDVAFDPDEADLAGAFAEEALSEEDARESAIDAVE